MFDRLLNMPLKSVALHLLCPALNIWDKVFKNGPSEIVEDSLEKISLGPFLNTLSHIIHVFYNPKPHRLHTSKTISPG